MRTTTKIFKTLLAIGLISTAKIAVDLLSEVEEDKKPTAPANTKISETNLTQIITEIRNEMNGHMNETPENHKLLRNYIKGRLATLEDIEKRIER